MRVFFFVVLSSLRKTTRTGRTAIARSSPARSLAVMFVAKWDLSARIEAGFEWTRVVMTSRDPSWIERDFGKKIFAFRFCVHFIPESRNPGRTDHCIALIQPLEEFVRQVGNLRYFIYASILVFWEFLRWSSCLRMFSNEDRRRVTQTDDTVTRGVLQGTGVYVWTEDHGTHGCSEIKVKSLGFDSCFIIVRAWNGVRVAQWNDHVTETLSWYFQLPENFGDSFLQSISTACKSCSFTGAGCVHFGP